MSTINSVRSLLIQFASNQSKAGEAVQKAVQQAAGAYTSAIQAAVVAGSAETFTQAIEGLMADIRANKGGVAVKCRAKLGKAPKDGGPAAYQVPGSISVVKSVLLGAFKYGIALTEDTEAAGEQPRSFGSIRRDVGDAAKAEKEAGMTPEQQLAVDMLSDAERLVLHAKRLIETPLSPDVMKALAVVVHETAEAVANEAHKAKEAATAAAQKAAKAKAASKPEPEPEADDAAELAAEAESPKPKQIRRKPVGAASKAPAKRKPRKAASKAA